VLVASKRHLALSIGAANPRAIDPNSPATERHRALLVAVPAGGAVGVMLALRADHLVDLGGHQLVHDAEPDADREREQALPRCSGEIAERKLDGLGQIGAHRLIRRCDLRCGYLVHGGSSCPRGLI